MPVKFIIGAAEVRGRYGIPDKIDINTVLESGLQSAHIFFQGALGTAFEVAIDQTDTFYIDKDVVPAISKLYRLRLKNAFVNADSVLVQYATTRVGLVSSPIQVESFVLDENKGLVFLDDVDVDGLAFDKKFVQVTYSSGFGKVADGFIAPPDWLKEAVLSWMAAPIATVSMKEKPAEALKLAEKIQKDAAMMVDGYKRETALQFLPIY